MYASLIPVRIARNPLIPPIVASPVNDPFKALVSSTNFTNAVVASSISSYTSSKSELTTIDSKVACSVFSFASNELAYELLNLSSAVPAELAATSVNSRTLL